MNSRVQRHPLCWQVFFTCIACCLLFAGVFAHAHITGASFERTIGEYLIDIGYSEEVMITHAPISFDFGLVNADTRVAVPFTNIWVIIKQDRKIFYAGGIHKPQIGATTMVYQFLEPGTYTLSVRFENGLDTIVQDEITFEVAESTDAPEHSRMVIYLGIIGGMMAGGTIAFFAPLLIRRKHNKIE